MTAIYNKIDAGFKLPEESIKFKSKKGKKLVLDADHYFVELEFEGKDICRYQMKNKGWDGMHFISGPQWQIIKPHLKYLFTMQDHNYYQLK